MKAQNLALTSKNHRSIWHLKKDKFSTWKDTLCSKKIYKFKKKNKKTKKQP